MIVTISLFKGIIFTTLDITIFFKDGYYAIKKLYNVFVYKGPRQLRWRRQFEETKNKTRRTSWKIKRTGKTTLEHLRKITRRKYPI